MVVLDPVAVREPAPAVRHLIRDLADSAGGFDVSRLNEVEVQSWLGDIRRAQRSLDGLVVGLARRADALATTGKSAPSAEVMRGDGAVSALQARRESRRAEVAEMMPAFGVALSNGQISGEHVDAVGREVTRLTADQHNLVDFDSLAQEAARLPVETFGRLVRRTIAAAVPTDPLADTQAKQEASEFQYWFDQEHGMGKFCGSLDPERYEALTSAIDQRSAAIVAASDGSVSKSPNLSAQALVELLLTAGDRGQRLPSITVVVDQATLTNGPHEESLLETESGLPLPAESVARLCCDAVLRRVTLDAQGVPIDVGRKRRTATDAQWAAIKAVHSRCGWYGCTAPISWCQAHHILKWEHGGRTDLDNLVPLCSQHHHRVHEGQWHIKLLPDLTLEIFRPDGTHHATTPRPSRC